MAFQYVRINPSFARPRMPYRPNARKLTQLIAAGFIASVLAYLVSYALTLIGAPTLTVADIFGQQLFGSSSSELETPLLWIGTFLYFVAGTVLFPLLFDYLADREILTNRRWLKGQLFAIGLWVFVEGLLKPIAGLGFFSSAMFNPLSNSVTSLVVWITYSLTLEVILRFRIAHELHVPAKTDRKAA